MSFHGHYKLLNLLEACATVPTLRATQCLHALTITTGSIPNQCIFIQNNIMSCYLSVGDVLCARKVFDRMHEKNIVSYNTLIKGYSEYGDSEKAWGLLSQMRRAHGFVPNQFTLGGLLSCGSLNLWQGVQLQGFSIKSGIFYADAFVGTALFGLFGRYECLDEAFCIFNSMSLKSLVTWNSMLSLLSQSGLIEDSTLLFRELLRTGFSLSESSVVSVLSGLASKGDLEFGQQIHGLITKYEFQHAMNAVNSILNMYSKCDHIFMAETFFEQMARRNVISWNTMLDAMTKSGRPEKALELFLDMYCGGVLPSQATFISVLDSCASLGTSLCGESVHALTIKSAFESDCIVGTALLDFYAKLYNMECSHKCFNEIHDKSTISFNALILGYSNSCPSIAIFLFRDMLQTGYSPNEFSFSAVLKSSLAPELQQIHSFIIRKGYENYGYVLSSIIISYIKNDLITEALRFVGIFSDSLLLVPSNIIAGVYNRAGQYYETVKLLCSLEEPDIVSYNIVIAACARSDNFIEVLELFKHMQLIDIKPDKYTFMSLLNVCTKLSDLDLGSSLHGLIIKRKVCSCDIYVSNLLIDMYGKCGSIKSSLKIFDETTDRNIITWTALVTAFGVNGYPQEALVSFRRMELHGMKPDGVALLAVLTACRHGRLVKEGIELFGQIKQSYGLEPTMDHYHCIVDLLAKNGYVGVAEKIIAAMPFSPNANIWRSILEGYRRLGTTGSQSRDEILVANS